MLTDFKTIYIYILLKFVICVQFVAQRGVVYSNSGIQPRATISVGDAFFKFNF